MSAFQNPGPRILAVCSSRGGIPKLPLEAAQVLTTGLVGDGRNHTKHIRPDRAVSLWDYELLLQLAGEGFPSLVPGAAGENLTVRGLNVQDQPPGTLLRIGDVVLRLEQPRKPCYVLDTIDPRLKDAIVGRCGYLASVVAEGIIRPGMRIEMLQTQEVPSAQSTPISPPAAPLFEPLPTEPGQHAYLLLAGPTIG